jgi:transketolase
MAMGAAHLAAKFNREGFPVVDNYVYAIVSDGDLMEGVASEAASLAGHLKLGKLIYLYDDNRVTIEGFTSLAFSEDVPGRFESYGWHTSTVEDGNDLDALEKAVRDAQGVTDRPSLISVKTVIGFGMPTAGTRKAHSDAPGAEAVKETKRALGWPEDQDFFIPEEALAVFRRCVERGEQQEREWNALVEKYAGQFAEQGEAAGSRTCPRSRTRSRWRPGRRAAKSSTRSRRTCPRSSAARPTSAPRPTPTSRAAAASRPSLTRGAPSTSACASTAWARR